MAITKEKNEIDLKIDRMTNLIKKFYLLNRSPVSEDTNALSRYVYEDLKCNKIEVNSGEECLTWIIPKNWKVKVAYLETLSGKRVVDFKDNPLHLWTHSVSYDGFIDAEELDKHLYFSEDRPDSIPYHYRNGFNYDSDTWGFCLSYNEYLKLNEDKYYVHIETELNNNGKMDVVDAVIKGQKKETIFFAAHTCHPGLVTDGISCVAVAIEVFKELRKRNNLKYTYRMILGPEYYAGAAFLEKTSIEETKDFIAGIYLDMLGNNEKFGFQTSFQTNEKIDKIVKNIFKYHVKDYVEKPYRKLWGNDEMFYNGPGFCIPTVGIGGAPHKGYHFSDDNFENLNVNQLVDSIELILKIIDVYELDFIPVRQYKGPLYLSRYGLYIDPKKDKKGYENLEGIQILMDGKRSCFEIAEKLDIDFYFVYNFCEKLIEKGLLTTNEK